MIFNSVPTATESTEDTEKGKSKKGKGKKGAGFAG